MPDQPQMRISDTDREHLACRLGQHLSAGRLTMSEYQDRLDAVYAARTRADTNKLLADLPIDPLPPDPVARNPARPRWAPWALTGAICLLVWITTSLIQGRPLEFWPAWVIGPWGIVLLTHRRRTDQPQKHHTP